MLLQIENPECRQSAIRRPWEPRVLASNPRSLRQLGMLLGMLKVSQIPQSLFDELLFPLVRMSRIIPQQIAQNIFQQLLKTAKLGAESFLGLNA